MRSTDDACYTEESVIILSKDYAVEEQLNAVKPFFTIENKNENESPSIHYSSQTKSNKTKLTSTKSTKKKQSILIYFLNFYIILHSNINIIYIKFFYIRKTSSAENVFTSTSTTVPIMDAELPIINEELTHILNVQPSKH